MTRPESEKDDTQVSGIPVRDVAVVIVAAGSGTRMGGSLPKQYCDLAGETVLARTLTCFLDHPRISDIQPVIGADAKTTYYQSIAELSDHVRLNEPVTGGETRQASVWAGLEALKDTSPRFVLITDAARPFVSKAQIERLLAALDARDPAAIPALAVVDTLKRADSGRVIESTVSRDNVFRVQTPQAFLYSAILEAHRDQAGKNLTDDAAVAEAVGLPVRMVDGDVRNVKLTLPEDLELAKAAMQTPRTGSGFDVHRLIDGEGVMLCGVFVKHNKMLSGHSDADVGLHALTDAILGAIGDGDIGDHFPPSDVTWKGADSAQFLAHAASLVAAKGGRITHVDVTLICERPKIGPYKHQMKERVAALLDIKTDRVSIKATTTERLGFTGRNEGIAAQAVATVLV